MDVRENGAPLLFRTGDGDGDAAVLRSGPGVVSFGGDGSLKRRERWGFESESRGGEVCRRVWKIAKRARREGSGGEGGDSCLHGRIVEAVLRAGEAGTHRIDAELESSESKSVAGVRSDVRGQPWRFMYFERGDWVEYGEEANSVVWERFRAGERTAEVAVENRVYLLNFTDMTQVNLATGYVRSIAWICDGWEVSLPANPRASPRGVADLGNRVNRHRTTWRDGATDSLSSFILGSGGAQGCELERNGAGNPSYDDFGATGGEVVHDDACISIDASGDYELTKLTLGGYTGGVCKTEQTDAKSAVFGFEEKSENLGNSSGFSSTLGQRFVKLSSGNKEFEDVKTKFLSGLGTLADGTMITGIHRDSSPVAIARQEAFERQIALTEQARGNANVRYGWHGTSKKGVAGIFLHGFGQPKTPKNGCAYGAGVYLALENQSFVSAVYADNDENGVQHVVLCQVIAGASELVKPPSEQFHPSSEHYDTGVDDLNAPKRLIVWSTHMNTHILPLYVVSFKLPPRWHRMMAELNGKQRNSSMFCYGVTGKHPFSTKQTCGIVEITRNKTCDMVEVLHNKPIGCQKGPTSAFIRFPQLFALLQRRLSPEQRLELKNCYAKFEAGSMSRRTLVQEIQKMVGRDCLIYAIQMCQGFHGRQATSVIKAQ